MQEKEGKNVSLFWLSLTYITILSKSSQNKKAPPNNFLNSSCTLAAEMTE